MNLSFNSCNARERKFPQNAHTTKICEHKINYGMIFVAFAKIGIKFFNFSSTANAYAVFRDEREKWENECRHVRECIKTETGEN